MSNTRSADAESGACAGREKGSDKRGMVRTHRAMRALVRKVLLPCIGLFFAGLVYLFVFRWLGHGIPCIVLLLTGYQCPGCGMTRALAAVFNGDLAAAMSYNALSLTVFPLVCLYLVYRRVREVLCGESGFSAWEYVFLIAAFAITVTYGIARNLL